MEKNMNNYIRTLLITLSTVSIVDFANAEIMTMKTINKLGETTDQCGSELIDFEKNFPIEFRKKVVPKHMEMKAKVDSGEATYNDFFLFHLELNDVCNKRLNQYKPPRTTKEIDKVSGQLRSCGEVIAGLDRDFAKEFGRTAEDILETLDGEVDTGNKSPNTLYDVLTVFNTECTEQLKKIPDRFKAIGVLNEKEMLSLQNLTETCSIALKEADQSYYKMLNTKMKIKGPASLKNAYRMFQYLSSCTSHVAKTLSDDQSETEAIESKPKPDTDNSANLKDYTAADFEMSDLAPGFGEVYLESVPQLKKHFYTKHPGNPIRQGARHYIRFGRHQGWTKPLMGMLFASDSHVDNYIKHYKLDEDKIWDKNVSPAEQRRRGATLHFLRKGHKDIQVDENSPVPENIAKLSKDARILWLKIKFFREEGEE